jgi:membrane protease YdiL (CAAX protease family)
VENGWGPGSGNGYDTGGSSTQLIPPAPARPDWPVVTWRWWEAIIVFLIGSLIGVIIAVPILASVKSTRLDNLVAGAAGEIGLGIGVIGWLWLMHRRDIGALGFPKQPAKEIGWGMLGGLALYGIGVFVIGTIFELILQNTSGKQVHSPRQLPTHLSGGEIALAGITVLVLAPICEELFFRGMIFKSLRARHGFWFAGPISAFFFGAAHYQGQWQNGLLLALVMVCVGLGLAFIYEKRGNIVANMAAHATFNVIGFIFIITLNK